MYTQGSVLIGIAMILLALAGVFAADRVVRPLHRITKAIESVTEGYSDDVLHVETYTETRQMSEAFNKMLGRLKLLDESREEFVSNVSHELKTPMTSMKVLADSLLEQENVPVEMYQEFMGDIAKEIDRENQIITDLLSLVKMDKTGQNINIQTVNINELLEQILKRLKPIAEKKNVEIHLDRVFRYLPKLTRRSFLLPCPIWWRTRSNITQIMAGSMYLLMQTTSFSISKWRTRVSVFRKKTRITFLNGFTGWTSPIPERSAEQDWVLPLQETR